MSQNCEKEQSVVDVESKKYEDLVKEVDILLNDPSTNPSQLLTDKLDQLSDQCTLLGNAISELIDCQNQNSSSSSSS